MIKPEILYLSKTQNTVLNDILKEERKIIKKILGLKLTDDKGYQLYSREKLRISQTLRLLSEKTLEKLYINCHQKTHQLPFGRHADMNPTRGNRKY